MNDRRKNVNSILWMVVIGLLLGFVISIVSENIQLKRHPRVVSSSKFDEVMYYINNMYVDTVASYKMEEDAIVSMMDELDPHSQYISLEEFNAVNDPLLGSFEGIGVQFRIVEDTVAIVNTIKGGPSEKVGIMAGDRIVYVNDSLIAGIKIQNDSVCFKFRDNTGIIGTIHYFVPPFFFCFFFAL